jgi:uncharacterized delta-60 repeat protein
MLNITKIAAYSRALTACRIARWVGCSLALLLATSAHAAPGDPDPGFGGTGRAAPLFAGVSGASASAVVIQPDGKIAVAAQCGSATYFVCVARRLPNGEPDPDFGGQGTIITTEQIGGDDRILMVMQKSGKLVIAFTCNPIYFCAIRLNANGTRDTSFGVGGKATVTAGVQNARTRAFAEQRDGKLVFAGECEPAGPPSFSASELGGYCAARITADGSMDVSFGAAGVEIVGAVPGVEPYSIFTVGIGEQANGKLVFAGQCKVSAEPPLPAATAACAFRRQSNGAPDISYGQNGLAAIRIATENFYSATATLMQPDDALVIGGHCNVQNLKACIARVNDRGQRDTTLQSNSAPSTFTFLLAMSQQRDGKILAAGQCYPSATPATRICFLRYNADGSIDASMPFVVDSFVDANAKSIVVQPDGKIVVVTAYLSSGARQAGLHRYQGGPFGNAACSLDIDGDGVLNPAIDGLLLTRAALGFTYSNLLAGISFPANAIRKQWRSGGDADIRKFLVSQCAMPLN